MRKSSGADTHPGSPPDRIVCHVCGIPTGPRDPAPPGHRCADGPEREAIQAEGCERMHPPAPKSSDTKRGNVSESAPENAGHGSSPILEDDAMPEL